MSLSVFCHAGNVELCSSYFCLRFCSCVRNRATETGENDPIVTGLFFFAVVFSVFMLLSRLQSRPVFTATWFMLLAFFIWQAIAGAYIIYCSKKSFSSPGKNWLSRFSFASVGVCFLVSFVLGVSEYTLNDDDSISSAFPLYPFSRTVLWSGMIPFRLLCGGAALSLAFRPTVEMQQADPPEQPSGPMVIDIFTMFAVLVAVVYVCMVSANYNANYPLVNFTVLSFCDMLLSLVILVLALVVIFIGWRKHDIAQRFRSMTHGWKHSVEVVSGLIFFVGVLMFQIISIAVWFGHCDEVQMEWNFLNISKANSIFGFFLAFVLQALFLLHIDDHNGLFRFIFPLLLARIVGMVFYESFDTPGLCQRKHNSIVSAFSAP